MAGKDYYETLGIEKGSSQEDIKRAYKTQAKKCHPDLHPGDKTAEDRFKSLGEAYSILSDENLRARYDQFGEAGVKGAQAAGGGPEGGFDFFTSVFENLFGGGGAEFGGSRRRAQGEDLLVELEIDFLEAAKGMKREITIPRMERCALCGGSGKTEETRERKCPTCRGAGKIQALHGFFTISRSCDHCGGTGALVTNPCKGCHGNGILQKSRTLVVEIPAGVDTGSKLRLEREGNHGLHGAPPGDLYVRTVVRPHAHFHRDGVDVHNELRLSMTQAALGAEVEAETIDGKRKVVVEAGVQTGSKLRLTGQGIPAIRARGRGDHYFHVFVETPTKLTPRQQELLREFIGEGDRVQGDKPHGPDSGFFDSIKKMFSGG